MATGRGNQLTKQVGEYLVAAELARRGFVAATFSGNIPDYDIVVTDAQFRSVPVQVKAITGNSWQLDIRRFVDVQLEGQKQVVGRPVRLSREIACVLVALGEYGTDRFYILEWRKLRNIVIREYKAYLKRKHGIRPRKFDSFHTAINEGQLARFRDNWGLLDQLA
jgi:hypothetical protein